MSVFRTRSEDRRKRPDRRRLCFRAWRRWYAWRNREGPSYRRRVAKPFDWPERLIQYAIRTKRFVLAPYRLTVEVVTEVSLPISDDFAAVPRLRSGRRLPSGKKSGHQIASGPSGTGSERRGAVPDGGAEPGGAIEVRARRDVGPQRPPQWLWFQGLLGGLVWAGFAGLVATFEWWSTGYAYQLNSEPFARTPELILGVLPIGVGVGLLFGVAAAMKDRSDSRRDRQPRSMLVRTLLAAALVLPLAGLFASWDSTGLTDTWAQSALFALSVGVMIAALTWLNVAAGSHDRRSRLWLSAIAGCFALPVSIGFAAMMLTGGAVHWLSIVPVLALLTLVGTVTVSNGERGAPRVAGRLGGLTVAVLCLSLNGFAFLAWFGTDAVPFNPTKVFDLDARTQHQVNLLSGVPDVAYLNIAVDSADVGDDRMAVVEFGDHPEGIEYRVEGIEHVNPQMALLPPGKHRVAVHAAQGEDLPSEESDEPGMQGPWGFLSDRDGATPLIATLLPRFATDDEAELIPEEIDVGMTVAKESGHEWDYVELTMTGGTFGGVIRGEVSSHLRDRSVEIVVFPTAVVDAGADGGAGEQADVQIFWSEVDTWAGGDARLEMAWDEPVPVSIDIRSERTGRTIGTHETTATIGTVRIGADGTYWYPVRMSAEASQCASRCVAGLMVGTNVLPTGHASHYWVDELHMRAIDEYRDYERVDNTPAQREAEYGEAVTAIKITLQRAVNVQQESGGSEELNRRFRTVCRFADERVDNKVGAAVRSSPLFAACDPYLVGWSGKPSSKTSDRGP